MSMSNKFGSAAFAAAGAAAEFLGSAKVKSPDLHDVAVDPTGRIDVLAARALKLAVSKIEDPVLGVLYAQFQPVIDHQLHTQLGRVKARVALEKLGIVQPRHRTKKTGVRKVRVASSGGKTRTRRKGGTK
jgi:hypothetical protein